MTYFRQIAATAGTVLLAATPSPERGAAQMSSGVEGTVWVRTSPAEPGGTFRIFLPNGTHVTSSCGETYRLDRWRSVSPTRLIVTEDGTRNSRSPSRSSASAATADRTQAHSDLSILIFPTFGRTRPWGADAAPSVSRPSGCGGVLHHVPKPGVFEQS